MNMNDFYTKPIRPDEIYHYGIKRRSGRYPYGSGDRPYQGEDVRYIRDQINRERKSRKTESLSKENLKIGQQRLENRKRVASIQKDRLSQKVGWRNTEKAADANKRLSEINKLTDEILSSEKRTRTLGDYTRKARNKIVTGTAISSVAGYGTTAAFLASVLGSSASVVLTLPVLPAAAIGIAGYEYYQRTKY